MITSSYTASGLLPDTIYTFKVRALNSIGYSNFSSELSVRASAKPTAPNTPVTSVISNQALVVTWAAPYNGGSAISSYTIKIRQSDGVTFSTDLANCDGSAAAII